VFITGLVGIISYRTIQLARRGQLLPAPPAPTAPAPLADQSASAVPPAAG
jgi:hypothetical protein